MSRWSSIASRVAGNWQLPALGLSLIALPLSLALLRTDPASMSFEKAEGALKLLVEAGAYDEAVQLAGKILAREDCTGEAAAPFHRHLARARYEAAERDGRRTANASRTVVHHFRQAVAFGATLPPDDLVRLAYAFEWSRQYGLALEAYEEALRRNYRHEPVLRKRIITLRRDELGATPQELSEAVDALLAVLPDDQLDLLLWALEEKLHLLDELGRLDEAEALVADYAGRFSDPSLALHFDYLHAWVLHHTGENAAAEAALRALRNGLDPDDPLSAKAGWLLGRTVLFDRGPQRPMEALTFFRDVLTRYPEGVFATACRLGSAEALAYLERDAEAIELYRAAITDLQSLDRARVLNRDVVRTSLSIQAERQRQDGRLAAALGYSELAAQLVDPERVEQAVAHFQQLAMLQSQYAERLRQRAAAKPGRREAVQPGRREAARPEAAEKPGRAPRDWRKLFTEAAATYAQLAEVDVHNERRASEAAWLAAEMLGRAGRRRDAIARYEQFVEGRPENALVPRALLRIGQLHHSAGRLTEAVGSYQACYRQFPRTLDGIRTLVPMAHAYVAMGPDHLDLAEKTLRIVLEESSVFTPDAPEFADALFLLGDVLERRGEFERAISVLHEAVDRYPGDPRVWRARYLLADCYRQSALALKREAAEARFEAEIEQIRTESRSRFSLARAQYRQLIDEYDARGPARLNDLERVHLRHAYLYEADCYFESQDYHEALALYEDAAGMFKDIPAGLSAYVQMIHCYVFLGQPQQARAALARARVVLNRMKPDAFAERLSPESKEDWEQYFDWLENAELF